MGGLLTPARPVPWMLRDCGWAVAVVFAVRIGLALISARTHHDNQLLRLPSSPAGGVASVLTSVVLLLAPVYIFAVRKRHARAADFGFVQFRFWRSAVLIGQAFLGGIAVTVVWSLIMLRFGRQMQPDLLGIFGGGWRGYLLALGAGAVVAPIAEEIFFRGFLFTGLRAHYSFAVAAGASGVLFALLHFMPAAIVPLAVYGIYLAWLREQTGSLWPSILMHMMLNGAGFTLRFVTAQ